uniref:Uncharacterized protein n=1 Tax=Arundo donax TaxID=35708 RepID=A0A0A8XVI3_ARUDO
MPIKDTRASLSPTSLLSEEALWQHVGLCPGALIK